jgi:hypothetical protein
MITDKIEFQDLLKLQPIPKSKENLMHTVLQRLEVQAKTAPVAGSV